MVIPAGDVYSGLFTLDKLRDELLFNPSVITTYTDLEIQRTLDFFYADYPSLRVSFEIVITDLDATVTDEDLSGILEQI